MITLYGVLAVSFMMLMYALEKSARGFIAAFALGCVLSSVSRLLVGRVALRRRGGCLVAHRVAPISRHVSLSRASSCAEDTAKG